MLRPHALARGMGGWLWYVWRLGQNDERAKAAQNIDQKQRGQGQGRKGLVSASGKADVHGQ
eukprot:2047490-Alexandrium_andersonii.AAC.1